MGILTRANLHAFVIRLWCDREHNEWRGHITHVETQQDCYFTSMRQLDEFIVDFLPIPAPSEVVRNSASNSWISELPGT